MNNRVADLRLQEGLSQSDLASIVGTSRQTIISIEKGRYDPGVKLAIRLARVFQLQVEEVFDLESD